MILILQKNVSKRQKYFIMNIRIISRLDIKGPNLVKGIQLEGLRVLGEPSDFAQFYYKMVQMRSYMDVLGHMAE